MDSVVSYYFKCKTGHHKRFTDPIRMKMNNGLVGFIDNRISNYVRNTDADFVTFFMKFYKFPYNNWAHLSHEKFNFIIRFENLQEDFAKALNLIGIELKRPLPVVNKTGVRESDFLSYYTPETIERAKKVFGPFMKQWGYEFPPEWGDASIHRWNQIKFEFLTIFMNVHWRYLRSRIYM